MSDQPTPQQPASDPKRELSVDRLRLRVAGLDEGAARKLARLVAEGLAPALRLPIGLGALETLRVEVPGKPGDEPEMLTRRILDGIGRALARDRAPAGSAGSPGGEEHAP